MVTAQKKRILLADDEPHIRTFIKLCLRSLNVEIVAEAGNGNEAVEAFRKHKPDLLLMDIMMPVSTGDEALRTIKAEFPTARVVMLTSMRDTDSVTKCLDAGASDYLLKDGAVADIVETVKRILQMDEV